MNIQGSTAKYLELSNQAYGVIVDTFASAMRSRLDFWKSVWQIASRPYASTAIASIMGENFDRASELTSLTVGELQSRVQSTADFSQKFLAHIGKLQDATHETYRDASTVGRVKDASTEMSGNGASTVDRVKDASTEMSGNGVSTVDRVKDASTEMSGNGVSTVDRVKDASTKMSGNGFKYQETPANPVSVTN
jgi:methyl-accepting chemotaxis protein